MLADKKLSAEKLKVYGQTLTEALSAAETWLDKQNILSEASKYSLNNILLETKRNCRDLAQAVELRPSIGIFGASQVGKSYLVSNLAKSSSDSSLNIIVPGTEEVVDFVQKMNPPGGGKEATGIVSRFTTVNTAWQKGYAPFSLRLFSQCDLVKVILNGYLSDISNNHYRVNREEVQQIIAGCHAEVAATQAGISKGFDLFDVLSLQDYVLRHFPNSVIVNELNNLSFWDDLRDLLPVMNYSSRYRLLEVFWGKHSFFSDLFNKASEALYRLNFRKNVRCHIDALSPIHDTIIDVERLREIFTLPESPKIALYDGADKITETDRGILGLITAEVCLPIPTKTAEDPDREFLKQTDILDFPGARSRNKILEQTFTGNSDVEKLEVLLRGKVAYLFDMYNERFELSALIYCMDDNQQEVQDLPHLIYSWLSQTHGDSPESRSKKESFLREYFGKNDHYNPLFIVQTKYNNDLQGNPSLEIEGDPSTHNSKWESRLEANLRQFMMRPIKDKWLDKWVPTDSFRNVFFLRDPKWSRNIYLSENGTETGLKDVYKQRIQDMKQSFLDHQASDSLFHDKKDAWNASALPGKSGVDEIVKYLLPVSHPAIKWLQVYNQLVNLAKELSDELSKYYIDSDINSELQKANRKSLSVLSLIAAHREKKMFGLMLDSIMLKDEAAWKLAYDLMIRGKHSGKNKVKDSISIDLVETLKKMGMPIADNPEVDEVVAMLKDFFKIEDNQDLIKGCQEVGINIDSLLDFLNDDTGERTASEIYAEDLLSFWYDNLQSLNRKENAEAWGLNENTLDILIDELKLTAERVALQQKITKRISHFMNEFTQHEDLKIIGRVATQVVNQFSGSLGWSEVALEERPKNELNKHIFDLQDSNFPDKSTLTLQLNTTNENYFVDWCTGYKEAFATNVHHKFGTGNEVNSEANQLLGNILQKVSSLEK